MKSYRKLSSKLKNEIHSNHTERAPLDTILLQVASSLQSISLLVSITYDKFFYIFFENVLKYPMGIRIFGILFVHLLPILQNLVEILYFS